ncbi:MAG: zinc-binding alcohol dehydrogenase family protein [Hyphomonadaceae bacterium]
MKAAIVREAGTAPVYGDFAEPVAGPGEQRIAVTAAAISHVVKSRASGEHYSSGGQFPFVAGIDGVGRLDDGRRVYFVMPQAPFGSMAEVVVVPERQCVPLPDDLDDVTAAAIANPGMSSWAALVERAGLKPGETVLVNGATGTSGRLAVQIAKYLGAGKVIAAARDKAGLGEMAGLGADETIALGDADLDRRLEQVFLQGVDVVIDYLWGASAERALIAGARAGEEARPIRFVQVGAASGQEIRLNSAVLRSSAITLMGSGIGSVPMRNLLGAIKGMLAAARPAGFRIAVTLAPLSDVERAWAADDSRRRTVFAMGAKSP